MTAQPSRFVLSFLTPCLLGCGLLASSDALATTTILTSGSYANLYGNSGTDSFPAPDQNTFNNTLVLGDASLGPTLADRITVIGGYASLGSTGNTSDNTLNINSGTIFLGTAATAYGGYSIGSGNSSNNNVNIYDFEANTGGFHLSIFGGRASLNGNASDNKVSIYSTTTENFETVYGGYSSNGSVDNNRVSIVGGGQIESIIGGKAIGTGTAGGPSGNKVLVTSGNAVIGNVTGGSSDGGSAQNNTVSFANLYTGNVSGSVVGGEVGGENIAASNKVTIEGGTFINGSKIVGGHSAGGSAKDNVVHIKGGIINGDIYGGTTETGSATGNLIDIDTSGVIYRNIYGGYRTSATPSAPGTNDVFTGNQLTLRNANVIQSVRNMSSILFMYGGSAGIASLDTTATGANGTPNVLIAVDSGRQITFSGNISGTGGITKIGDGTLSLSAMNNTYSGDTNVTAGSLTGSIPVNTNLTVASGAMYGSSSTSVSVKALNGAGALDIALSNLTVQSGSFSGSIHGALSLTKTGTGILTLSGANSVASTTISGGLINFNSVSNFGSSSISINGGGLQWATGTATDISTRLGMIGTGGATFDTNGNNVVLANHLVGSGGIVKSGEGTLTLSGSNTLMGATEVRAGTLALASSAELTSRSLTLFGGSTFKSVDVDGHVLTNGDLTVRGENTTYDGNLSAVGAAINFIAPANLSQPLLNVTGTADISDSSVNVGLSGGTSLAMGSRITLIQAAGGLTSDNVVQGSGIVESGVTTLYGLTIESDPLTGLLFGTVTSGGSNEKSKALSEGFLSGLGLVTQGADILAGKGMDSAVQAAGRAGGYGFSSFGAVSGGSMRYNTGSHVDTNSVSVLAGLAWGTESAPEKMTFGTFFEYGNGSYDTHNSFANSGVVKGDGNTHYLGGGLLGRMDFAPRGAGRFYAEASARAGKLYNDYDNADLHDLNNVKASYDSSAAYYGLHFGGGYVWTLMEKASLDLYGKYFWTRQEGDSVTLSTGEDVRFKQANSSRLRFGSRFGYAVNKFVTPYVGAAYEHEFDSEARATTNGFAIEAPSMRGNTGIGEVGLTLKPAESLPLSLDLGAQGYVGKREGVTGSLQAKWAF